MSKNLFPFSFESHEVRVLTDEDGAPLFVANDAAEALGYKDPTTAVRSHCKGVQELHPLSTPGGMQELRVIREPDLYRLIFGSTLESAQAFERLVVEVILPTIRKTGRYEVPTTSPSRIVRLGADDPPACLSWRIESAITDYIRRYLNEVRRFLEDDMAAVAREMVRHGYSEKDVQRLLQQYRVTELRVEHPPL